MRAVQTILAAFLVFAARDAFADQDYCGDVPGNEMHISQTSSGTYELIEVSIPKKYGAGKFDQISVNCGNPVQLQLSVQQLERVGAGLRLHLYLAVKHDSIALDASYSKRKWFSLLKGTIPAS